MANMVSHAKPIIKYSNNLSFFIAFHFYFPDLINKYKKNMIATMVSHVNQVRKYTKGLFLFFMRFGMITMLTIRCPLFKQDANLSQSRQVHL